MSLTLTLILFSIFLIIFGSASYAGFSAAPWVPTKRKESKNIAEHLSIKAGKRFYELGCGTGTVLFALARQNPGAQFIGFEISVFPYLYAKLRKVLGGEKYQNVSIRFKSIFRQDLKEADVIFLFLLDSAYPKLRKKFSQELKDGAQVVVQAWPFDNIEPSRIIDTKGCLPLFFYRGAQFR